MENLSKYILLIALLYGFVSCSDNDDAENVEPNVQEGLYFPPVGSSSWETTDLQQLGWDPGNLQAAITYAEERNTHALIILHRGRIVAEHYWKEKDRNTKHNIESAGKGMAAFLIGILQQDFDFDISEKVSAYLGSGWSNAPEEKENLITVEQLLSMTSGLDYKKDYLADAGTAWYYSTEAFDVLFQLIENVSQLSLEEFSDRYLFSKIGMDQATWENLTVNCTARDMARFGLLILAEGKWEDDELLKDKDYYTAMLNTSQSFQPPYGYLWWLNGKESYIEFEEGEEDVVYPGPLYPSMPDDGVVSAGWHDQRIEVIPSLELVVVRQGGDPQTSERGDDSYANGFWSRLMMAIRN